MVFKSAKQTYEHNFTSVIIGIVCAALLGVLVYLNRDKFGFKKAPADAPADDTPAEF